MTNSGKRSGLQRLDDFDRRILGLVQIDNQTPNAAIAEQIGLSESAVRKRLANLRKNGVIAADVSVLAEDPSRVHLIVIVTLSEFSQAAHAKLQALIEKTDEIGEAFHIAGKEDYILILNCPNLQWYETWSMREFVAAPFIGQFETRIAWSRLKTTTAVSIMPSQ